MVTRLDKALAVTRAVRKVPSRAALDAGELLILAGLPMPPSVNELFANVAGKGRIRSDRYRIWAQAAGWAVRAAAQGRRVGGPVRLTYVFGEGGTKADLGNLEKALTDLMVDLCLIDGDGKKIVRGIALEWGPGDKVTVRIKPEPPQAALFREAA